jgi:hypothetical protein
MKKWFILAGIVALIIIGGYFVLSFYAVKFIQSQLQKVVEPGFTVSEIQVKSTYLSAKGIRYEDPDSKQKFFQIEEMRIYPNIFTLLKGTLDIREFTILQPSLYFYRSREGILVGPWGPWEGMEKGREGKGISTDKEGKGKEPLHIKIDRIRIEKGSVDFEDRKVGEPPGQIKLRGLDFEIRDIRYPLVPLPSPVELKGKMKGPTKEGSIHIKGWIDLKTMDMENSLEFREVEIRTFEPYYRKRATVEIESGDTNMDLNISVKKKRIDGPGKLDLTNLHVKKGGGMVFWIPAETLVSLLEKKGNEIKAKFHVRGDMGNPRFSLQETFLTQVGISLAQALGIPIKVLGEGILEGTLEGEKGLVEGLQAIDKLFKKKREKKK